MKNKNKNLDLINKVMEKIWDDSAQILCLTMVLLLGRSSFRNCF